MSLRSLIQLVLALTPVGVLSGQATVFRGAPGKLGNVVVMPAPESSGSRPPELQGIRILPVDAGGRSAYSQFLPDQPRLKTDIPLASRVLLPQGQGALYRFERPESSGSVFGFFVVRPSGLAEFLASFRGAGPLGDQDPIPEPVGLSASGDGMLVATTLAAGGDVFEIDIATGAKRNLTKFHPPLDVQSQGLILQDDWGAVLTDSEAFRFNRGGGQIHSIDMRRRYRRGRLGANHGPAPTDIGPLEHFGNGMARSADGSTVAVIAGVSAAESHVYTFGLAGDPVCVNQTPAPIVDPAYGTEGAPMLALAPNGQRVAWKTQTASGEIFSRRVPHQPTPPELQITSDLHFDDTLNDTGVIAFFDPDSVVVLVGEVNGVGGIERGDFYRTSFPAGGGAPQFTNLSKTSGDLSAPFLELGDIDSSDGLFLTPAHDGMVYFVSGSSGQGFIYRLDGSTGIVKTVRDEVEALDFIECAGSDFVLGVTLDTTARHELFHIPADFAQASTSIGLFQPTQTFLSRAGSQSGTFAGLVNMPGGQELVRMSLPTNTGTSLPGVFSFGTALGFDGAGEVLASVQNTVATFFFSLSADGTTHYYGSGPLQSFVLPAN